MLLKLCQSVRRAGTLVLPITIAPAAFNRCTASASASGRQLESTKPPVVGSPATLNDSLTVIGRPSSVRVLRGGAGAFKIAHDDRIDLGVEGFDAGNGGLDQLARGDLPAGKRLHQFGGGVIGGAGRN